MSAEAMGCQHGLQVVQVGVHGVQVVTELGPGEREGAGDMASRHPQVSPASLVPSCQPALCRLTGGPEVGPWAAVGWDT